MSVHLNACCRPIEKRERSLQHSGPTWRAPMLHDTLYNLPFLRHAPRKLIEVGSDGSCSLNQPFLILLQCQRCACMVCIVTALPILSFAVVTAHVG